MTAAAARKLQKDIDVVLKKVDDGLDEFSQVWDQATTASNSAQRDKHGEELKRSINKLQRLRAQIREWISQSDIKNNSKDKLEEARKRIEADMQRFKEFERDLKTKAFSTCALAKADELDMEEAEKIKYQEWLVQTIQELNDQQDQFEADLELLGNKKSLSGDERSRQTFAKTLQDRHRWHIHKLELILRALDNDGIDTTDLAVVRDSVDVYLDQHAVPDFPHDEGLYDCFDLVEFEEKTVKAQTPVGADAAPKDSTPSNKEEPAKKTKDKKDRKKDDKKDKKREEREKKAAAGVASPASGGGSAKSAGLTTPGRPGAAAGGAGGRAQSGDAKDRGSMSASGGGSSPGALDMKAG